MQASPHRREPAPDLGMRPPRRRRPIGPLTGHELYFRAQLEKGGVRDPGFARRSASGECPWTSAVEREAAAYQVWLYDHREGS